MRRRRVKDRQPTVWVPEGTELMVSQDVRVLPMAVRTEPLRLSRGTARSDRSERGDSSWEERSQRTPSGSEDARRQYSWRKDSWREYSRRHAGRRGERKGEKPKADDQMTVPPEVLAQAEAVMKLYDMKVSGMTLMATKPEKGGAIWRIETNRGPRSLKQLHRAAARSLFSVGAQEYLVKQGARVPALVRSRSKELCILVEGKLWIVTDWIEELTPATKDLAGAQALCYGLGEFHRHSRGYVPPVGARHSSRLYRWPQTYQKMLNKMNWFREIARAYSELPAAPALSAMVDTFEQQAREALARLEQSPYATLVARGEPAWGLVHQDYGWSNGQMGPGGVWIIDLDGVAYDLPIRDLRKLIASTMDDHGTWDPAWIKGMIDAYSEANPIKSDLYQVLLTDFSLPNEFYKHVKECVRDPVAFMGPELNALLERLQSTDVSKWQALRELGLDARRSRPERRHSR